MKEEKRNIEFYQRKLCKLRVDRSSGLAPHKPILLLSVLELIERGEIKENRIYPSADLIATFHKYWKYLGSDTHHALFYLPFYHLRGDGFWHLESPESLRKIIGSFRPKSLRSLKEIVYYAKFDSRLFNFLIQPQPRHLLIDTVIQHWFSEKQQAVQALLKQDALSEFQGELEKNGGKIYAPEEVEDEEKNIVRSAAFRRVITGIYEKCCACCGLQVIASDGRGIVDGAHIRPFSRFFDDRITNGIALCKNHHWAFDRGWFGIDKNYKMIISKSLWEKTTYSPFLTAFEGKKITLPIYEKHYPDPDSLAWHYENCFQKP